jgi:phosphoglycerate dehydrogenase-like enzyme
VTSTAPTGPEPNENAGEGPLIVIGAQLAAAQLDRVRDATDARARIEVAPAREALPALLAEAEAYLAGPFNAALLAAAPKLRWVHSSGAGVEGLLFPEVVASDVVLTNARGAHRVAMPEYVLMCMLAWTHHLPQLLDAQRRREWIHPAAQEINGKTLGLLGYGEIGRAVANRARPLGVRCIALRRDPARQEGGDLVERVYGPQQLHDFLRDCDFVVNSLPLTDETRGVFDEAAFAAMRHTAVLIHLGRGPTVQQDALLQALRDRWIAGAFLDVFDAEPLPPDAPLWTVENAIITSHTSGNSVRYMERSIDIFCDNVRRFVAGDKLRNIVDKRRGY